jgi:hypothetical protein
MNKRNEGEEKDILLISWSKVMTFSLQSFPIQNQTITPNFFFKNPKYYYRFNPKHVSLSKELQPQLQNLTHNLDNYTKTI